MEKCSHEQFLKPVVAFCSSRILFALPLDLLYYFSHFTQLYLVFP
jgi:hypothetical protein